MENFLLELNTHNINGLKVARGPQNITLLCGGRKQRSRMWLAQASASLPLYPAGGGRVINYLVNYLILGQLPQSCVVGGLLIELCVTGFPKIVSGGLKLQLSATMLIYHG